MKKNKLNFLKNVLLMISVAMLSLLFMAGCNGGEELSAPSELKMKKGVLSWTAENGAVYEYSLDGLNYTETEENEINLPEKITSAEVSKVYVRSVKGDKKSDAAEFPLTVIQLKAPEKPVVTVDSETQAKRIAWNAVENAEKYEIKVNDGNWTTSAKNYYVPNRTGDYTVTVRCKAYGDNSTIYLRSTESEASDTFQFLESPALDCPAIHVLSLNTSVDFDSYNLWINKSGTSQKRKIENIQLTDGRINLVTNGYITETGEYDLQVEAVKDGVSWWTATYPEFGTTNINEKELFSFDNRTNRLTPSTQQAMIGVSDEQYLGKDEDKQGYSLKIDGSNGNLREIGLLKYAADGINDIDFRDVTQISYWLFVPSGQSLNGSQVTQLSGAQLPAVRYQQYIQSNEESAYGTAVVYPSQDTVVPVDTWTQITLDVENGYEHIIMFVVPNISAGRLVVYIDDITYETTTDRSEIYNAEANKPDDAEYVLTYTNIAMDTKAWYNTGRVKLLFGEQYANRTVKFSVDVKGTAPVSSDAGEWPKFIGHSRLTGEKDADGNKYYIGYYAIPSGVVTQTAEWKTVEIITKLNEEGNIYLNIAAKYGEINEEFIVYMKNVQFCGLVANSAACIAANGNVDASYDYKWIVLPIDSSVASVGDTVQITMDMFIRPDKSTWESMPCTMSGNMNPYVANGTQAYLQADKTGNVRANNWATEELGQWHTFTFYAGVIDQKTIQRDEKNAQITINEDQYVLLWWYSAGNGIAPNNNGAKAEWCYKQPTAIVNYGKAANSQNDVKFTNFTHKWIAIEIDESVASIGDTVQITMDMFIKPENCAYENKPCVAVSFNDNNTVNFGEIKMIQTNKTGTWNENWAAEELGQWHTFTFEAVVIDQAQVLKDTYNTAITMPGKQYVLLWWQSAGAGKTNAAAEWYYKLPTAIQKVSE